MMALSPEATELLEAYMLIIAGGVPFTAVLFAGISCARGAGDSMRPLMAMVVVNVVNIVVSWVLAGVPISRPDWAGGGPIPNPFGFNLGVQGIAIGTVVGHGVGTLIILAMAGTAAG